MSFQEEVKKVRIRTNSYLITLEELAPSLERIWDLVQENSEFFNCHLGDDKLSAAADKLEEIVRDHNGG